MNTKCVYVYLFHLRLCRCRCRRCDHRHYRFCCCFKETFIKHMLCDDDCDTKYLDDHLQGIHNRPNRKTKAKIYSISKNSLLCFIIVKNGWCLNVWNAIMRLEAHANTNQQTHNQLQTHIDYVSNPWVISLIISIWSTRNPFKCKQCTTTATINTRCKITTKF